MGSSSRYKESFKGANSSIGDVINDKTHMDRYLSSKLCRSGI
jgi:hypothetical protein